MSFIDIIKSNKRSLGLECILDAGRGKFFHSNSPKIPLPPMLMVTGVESYTGMHFDYYDDLYAKNPNITHDDLSFVYDSKTCVAEDSRITAFMDIAEDEWFFKAHFYNDPVMPGCLMLDGFMQVMGLYASTCGNKGLGRAAGTEKVKFISEVTPSAGRIYYNVHIKSIKNFGKVTFVVADGDVTCNGKPAISCASAKVIIVNE